MTIETTQSRSTSTARDLISVGVFAALYAVIVFAFNFLGFLNPVAMVVGLLVGLVAGGVPFMLFLTRVHRPGMIVLFAVLFGAVLLITGHPVVAIGLLLVLAVVAEAIMYLGRYRSRSAAVAAYTVFSLWAAGQLLPLFYDRSGYLDGAGMQEMSAEYVDSLDRLLSVPVLIGVDLATVVFGLAGALLGLRLLDKHFRRAGLS
ncbi:MptD family putative ECF transporter S component [Gordonia hydrophobica]|uniref:MptD family putative ECF transporter S component n=1 Tax=Gordonia hydrophobica TaxID=40516 RepID=A0ABZ2U586_9ACTN|nr:MptD family putative ECF transporter S component [Gordonia hydrophobica]MBM7367308.1 energy-coupling factor transport system substrate-specific component [Gordonia hydrophobica]